MTLSSLCPSSFDRQERPDTPFQYTICPTSIDNMQSKLQGSSCMEYQLKLRLPFLSVQLYSESATDERAVVLPTPYSKVCAWRTA